MADTLNGLLSKLPDSDTLEDRRPFRIPEEPIDPKSLLDRRPNIIPEEPIDPEEYEQKLSFDPEGSGYDTDLYQVAVDFYNNEIAQGRYKGRNPYLAEVSGPNKGHTPSAIPVGILVEQGIITREDLEKYNLPERGSILLKGFNYETTPLELDAVKKLNLEYKKVSTPIGERYVAFPKSEFQKGGTKMANTEELYDDMGAQMELAGLVSEPTDRDPVSGNEIPLGATAEGVRDDQTAAISPGEFVIPDYAVRYHGLDFYVDSLQQAKQGLQQMDGMGLVGNPDEQTIPDEAPLPTMPMSSSEEEPQTEFQTGGLAQAQNSSLLKLALNDINTLTGGALSSMFAEAMQKKPELAKFGSSMEQIIPALMSQSQPMRKFQTGGLATTQLYGPTQQDTAATTASPLIEPIRPISSQPLPIAPTVPMSPQTPQLLTQFQQGYYFESAPGLFQFVPPPGQSATGGLLSRDQLPAGAQIAPPGTRYEDVFGPGVSGEGLQKQFLGATIPSQSQYLQLQGQAAGAPGGYKIEPFTNEEGNFLYLTTVGGQVLGGAPPGYRKATPEELGLPSTTAPATAPAQEAPPPPDVSPGDILGGAGGFVQASGGVNNSASTAVGLISDFSNLDAINSALGYVNSGNSQIGEQTGITTKSLDIFDVKAQLEMQLEGNLVSKTGAFLVDNSLIGRLFGLLGLKPKNAEERNQKIQENLDKVNAIIDANYGPSLVGPGQATGNTLSVDGKDFAIGHGANKVDPSLAAAVVGKGAGKISTTSGGGTGTTGPATSPTGPVDLSGLASSVDLGPGESGGGTVSTSPSGDSVDAPAGMGADQGRGEAEAASLGFGIAKGGLVTKKRKQKKGSKGLASV